MTDSEYENNLERTIRDDYTESQVEKREKLDLRLTEKSNITEPLMLAILEAILNDQKKEMLLEKRELMAKDMMIQYKIELDLVSDYNKKMGHQKMAAFNQVEMVIQGKVKKL